MRRCATFIASLLLIACGGEEKPVPKTSDYKSSNFVPAAAETGTVEPGATFVDVTRAAGIDFVHVNGAVGDKWLPETMGSGVGMLDYDGDGDLDLLFVQSDEWKSGGHTMKLYRNDGGWKFVDVTGEAGLAIPCYGMGVAIADYDADGDPDFYLTCLQRNDLFRNDGGTFVRVEGGPDGGMYQDGDAPRPSWSTGAAWFDADGDDDLDLLVINYVKWAPGRDVYHTAEGRTKDYSRPQLYDGETPRLYLQEEDGSFRDATKDSGLAEAAVPGKSMAICVDDFDRDGRPDVFIANDTVQNFLFLNRGGAKFEEVGLRAGVAYSDTGRARAAMGIDSFDFSNTGAISVLIGNFSEEPVSFFTTVKDAGGEVLFRDDAAKSRVGQPTLQPLTFGLLLRDLDLDGWTDLLLGNGHISPTVQEIKPELSYAQTPQYFRNLQGRRMVDVSRAAGAPFQEPMVARGLAAGDLDGDGDLDVVFTCNNDRPRVLRNDLTTKHRSLRIRLRQPGKNRDALGAVVLVKSSAGTQRGMVRTGGSYLSQGELTLTFGLGDDADAAVTVVWPDGTREERGRLAAGAHTLARE